MSEEMVPLRKNAKKVLGRGLGSLLGEASSLPAQEDSGFERVETVKKNAAAESAATASPSINLERVWKVPIEKIIPNKEQPRKTFDPVKLQELAHSIKEKGIILPILVRELGSGQYEIIAGERRWRAAQQAGLQDVPIILRKTDNKEALEIALIENIQRQDINPIEEAEAYELLTVKYGLTQQQIAEKVSKDRSTVANLLRLVHLTAQVKAMVKSGELSLGQAKVLLAINDPQLQIQAAKKIAKQGLSVRAAERLLTKMTADPLAALELDDDKAAVTQKNIQPLISELEKLLGTKIEIDMKGQRSKVSIHFYSYPELNQFIDKIRKLRQ